jgi:hypothetical protein
VPEGVHLREGKPRHEGNFSVRRHCPSLLNHCWLITNTSPKAVRLHSGYDWVWAQNPTLVGGPRVGCGLAEVHHIAWILLLKKGVPSLWQCGAALSAGMLYQFRLYCVLVRYLQGPDQKMNQPLHFFAIGWAVGRFVSILAE